MNLRKKIVNKELVVGTWLQTGDPTTAEIIAECGYDFIAADIEHTSISEKDFVDFARVASSDEMTIRRMLALGTDILFVNNEARKTVALVRN